MRAASVSKSLTRAVGWDMRPARLIGLGFGQPQRFPGLVDASGARHLLKDRPPWSTVTGNDPDPGVDYTTDGTNYRFTVVDDDTQGRATGNSARDCQSGYL